MAEKTTRDRRRAELAGRPRPPRSRSAPHPDALAEDDREPAATPDTERGDHDAREGGEINSPANEPDRSSPTEQQESESGRNIPNNSGDAGETEIREVLVDDPNLSPAANAALTEDLRLAVGADRVEVPKDRPHPSLGENHKKATAGGFVSENKPVIFVTFTALLVVGAILTLITDDWWFLPLAAFVHVVATMAVVAYVLRLVTSPERPSATTAALVEDEGIKDIEGHFSDIVAEFTHGDRRGASALAGTGSGGSRDADTLTDPHDAAAQQQTSWTPSATPSEATDDALPDTIATILISGVVVASFVFAIILGHAMWFAPAILVPFGLAWVFLRKLVSPIEGDPAREATRERVAPWIIMGSTVAGVTIFCALVAVFIYA
jgi:hypothetical protein